jgi:hypothetical protein
MGGIAVMWDEMLAFEGRNAGIILHKTSFSL